MDEVQEYVRARPAAALASWVTAYSGYRTIGAPERHRGLPSPGLTVILTLEDPLVITSHPDPAQTPGRYDALIGGLHTTPALIRHDGRQSGVQLSLSPLGAPALLGMPAGELGGVDVDAHDVWPRCAELLDHLRAARARFRTEIGLSPKVAARVVRFDRARRRLGARVGSGGAPALADLAVTCGYYDQAHLAREFVALAGVPPSTWLAEEYASVRAMGPQWWEAGSPSMAS